MELPKDYRGVHHKLIKYVVFSRSIGILLTDTLKSLSKLKFHVDSESARYQNRKSIFKKLRKIIIYYNIYNIKNSLGTDDFHKI